MAISTLDLLVRKTAVQVNIDESTVEEVIRFKWKSLHDAMLLSRAVEDSGLGKFKIRDKMVLKALGTIEREIDRFHRDLEEEGITERRKETIMRKILSAKDSLEYVKSKL